MGVLVRQRSDKPGSGWWLIVAYRGKRQKIHIGHDKRTAEEAARALRRELMLGRVPIGRDGREEIPIDRYFPDWLQTHAQPHCKPSTTTGYEIAWRVWIHPVLGSMDLQAITRADVRAIVARMQEAGKSRPYIKGTLAPLSAVLNRAVEDGLIPTNPALRILPKLRHEQATKAAQPLTSEQLVHLLITARQHFPDTYPLVLTFARAGLRIGEAVALQVKQVDCIQHCLWITRNYVKGRIQTTKSGKGRRVDMSEQLEAELRRVCAGKPPDALVFPSRAGTVLRPDNFRKRTWAKLFIKAGLPRIRVHDLRHTFASLLIQQGVPPPYVKEQMGHYSIRITVDTYGHLVPGANRQWVNLLDH